MTARPRSKLRSCSDCVKAKRRCTMDLPRCARCEKKNNPCVYPNLSQTLDDIAIPELEFSWLDELMQDSNVLPWDGRLQSQVNAVSDSTFSGSLESDALSMTPPKPIAVEVLEEPEYLKSSETCSANTLSNLQAQAAVNRFKSWPEKWVKEGKAPFIHPRLYTQNMPKSLQDAYAACAIYSVKTEHNADIAFTVITSRANELLRAPDQDSWTPLDYLAAVQALIIFQFIRLFDGDIQQRVEAEKAEVTLQAWTEELKALTKQEQTFTTDTAPSWRSWIFAESVRRTILMSIFLCGVYSFVKNGFCSVGPQVAANSFMGHRLYWEAKNAVEWARVKESCSPHWISRFDFENLLQNAQADEIDDFAVLLMISAKGQEAVDHWMANVKNQRQMVMGISINQNEIA